MIILKKYRIEIKNDYSIIDEHVLRKSLNSMEERLNRDQFIRIHRSTIVNIDYIQSIERYTSDEHLIIMKNGNKYRISKTGRKILKDKFQ